MAESKFARPSRITIPQHCHPLAKLVFAEMRRQGRTYDELEHYSGVLRSTLKAWRTYSRPGIETVEAVLGVLGWDLMATPRPSQMPEELTAELDALAARWNGQLTEFRPALIAAAARAYETIPLTAAGSSRRPVPALAA